MCECILIFHEEKQGREKRKIWLGNMEGKCGINKKGTKNKRKNWYKAHFVENIQRQKINWFFLECYELDDDDDVSVEEFSKFTLVLVHIF